jgi:hypothetical protein
LSDLQLSDLKNNNTNSIVFRPSSVDVMRNHESSSDDEEDNGVEREIEEGGGEDIIQVKDDMDVLSFVVSEKEKKQNHNKR